MNEIRRRGPIARFFVGLWDAMNFTPPAGVQPAVLRPAAARAGRDRRRRAAEPLLDRTTLVIAPEGKLVEQYSSDPASRALAQRSATTATAKCSCATCCARSTRRRDDKRIERVLLRADRMEFSGYASIREVAAALARLRASGKQVVAFGESFDAGPVPARRAGQRGLPRPDGRLMLEGLGRYRQYYREGLQDKLGVDVHLFRVGEYKSAAEPYILDAASPAVQGSRPVLDERHLAALPRPTSRACASCRAQQLAAGIDTLPQGLAAAQRRPRAVRAAAETRRRPEDRRGQSTTCWRSAASPTRDAEDGFREVAFDSYLEHIDSGLDAVDERVRRWRWWSPKARSPAASSRPAASVANRPPRCCATRATTNSVKALVLRVDSPGGEVFASEQIRREVAALKGAGKPVVVSMGDVAASGGYWISMNADRIYADPSTITGSIGIFGLIPTHPAHARQDRRAHRRRRHHALRRRVRHHPAARSGRSATWSSR